MSPSSPSAARRPGSPGRAARLRAGLVPTAPGWRRRVLLLVALAHVPALLVLVLLVARQGGLELGTAVLLVLPLLLVEALVVDLLLRAGAQVRATADDLAGELAEGRSSVRARLAEADRIRADLIGTVSHEFRTPLTGIRVAALTLLKRGSRLDEAARARLLHGVLDHQERLSRLLENMLTAAQATSTDPAAVAEVDAVAAEVAMLAESARPQAGPVQVVVEAGTTARIDRQALHQVLANLVDNAQQHGSPGAVPIVAGGEDTSGVWLTVSNDGSSLDLEAANRLFEPFTQADGGATRGREGLGMGLYVVRRLVEVHGGTVDVRSEGGWVTVELRLRPVVQGQTPVPTALPIA